MKLAFLMWPDTFEDWYKPLGIDRRFYLDEYDGEWAISAARALVGAGADVHLVFMTLDEEGQALQTPSGATVHFVRAPAAYRGLRTAVWGHDHWERTQRVWPLAPYVATASVRLFGHLRRMRPDLVIVQDYEMPRFDVAALALSRMGIPFVGLDTGGSAAPSDRPWKNWTTRQAKALLAIHSAEAERVRHQRRPRRVDVWPIPVRSDLYGPRDRSEARARLGIEPAARVVVSVGRLHTVKNLPLLVDACEGLDCQLVLIGSGDEEDALRRRRANFLRLVGRLPPAEVADWYAAADVVALASRQEGQPVAVLEAFACGRGVVATRVGGVPDVVTEGRTGWLVAPNDVEALRGALRDALADPVETDRRGSAGRVTVLERHALEGAGRGLMELLSR